MAGHFDREEWSFECKRDDRDAKIQEIKKSWKDWAAKRYVDNAPLHNALIDDFAIKECNEEIAKLK